MAGASIFSLSQLEAIRNEVFLLLILAAASLACAMICVRFGMLAGVIAFTLTSLTFIVANFPNESVL